VSRTGPTGPPLRAEIDVLQAITRTFAAKRRFRRRAGSCTVADVSLAEVRSQIDQIDEHIVRLLAARQKLVKEAALHKTDEHSVRAPDRRAAMMARRHEWAIREGVSPEVVRRVYDAMVEAFIDLELREHTQINRADPRN